MASFQLKQIDVFWSFPFQTYGISLRDCDRVWLLDYNGVLQAFDSLNLNMNYDQK